MAKSLIPVSTGVINNETTQTVNARDLHAFLGVGKVFAAWIQERIEQYGFVQKRDFEVFSDSGKNPTGGRPSKEYAITLDMAKELAMVERNEKGKQARQYFIECEKRLHASQKPPSAGLPQLRQARAIKTATDAAERIFSNLIHLGEESKQVIYANLINPIAEREVIPLPRLIERTYTAGEVGERLNISANLVGRLANIHHLKTSEYGRFVLDKARHSDKQVEVFRYNEAGIEKIASLLTLPPAGRYTAEVRP